ACSYILPLCAVMLPLVLITVLFNYLIAVNDKIFVAITGISTAILLLVTVAFVHTSPTVILIIMAAMYSLSFIVSLIRSIKINA
ncbi:MAG: hypothetical protein K5761_05760, partial [Clostridiales bacterium]|nr:hypothetical protein [Clostridiales bacterium]